MSDDTGEPAVEGDVQEEPTYVTKSDLEAFGETIVQKMSSHYGRISKEQVNKNLDPDLINEQLSSKLFGGDVVGTIKEVVSSMKNEEKRALTEKEKLIDAEMEKFKDDKIFKETSADVKKLALQAIKERGFPPGPAVELAVDKAARNYLSNRDPEYRLEMSGVGKQAPRTKQKKLPSELKSAAARDIADGLFKDEAEYMQQLSPNLKAKYGI